MAEIVGDSGVVKEMGDYRLLATRDWTGPAASSMGDELDRLRDKVVEAIRKEREESA